MAARDVLLAEMTGGHVHIAHMSAGRRSKLCGRAKSRGVKVTCEVTPHHFTLTDDLLASPVPYDTNTKMNPPLREARDRDAMIAGIADGSVDVIATDHAPHHYDEKNVEYDRAPFGIVGLETGDSDRDRSPGACRRDQAVAADRIDVASTPRGSCECRADRWPRAAPADITMLAPDLSVTIDRARFRSRSKNTPFHGWTFRGGVAATIVGGRVVYANAEVPFLKESSPVRGNPSGFAGHRA